MNVIAILLMLFDSTLGAQQTSARTKRMAPADSIWVTIRVDSLNLGYLNEPGHLGGRHGLCYGPDCHDWVWSETRFLQHNQHPPGILSAGESWTETQREAICRICLRHEWQAQKRVPRPTSKSEFEELHEQLVQFYEVHPDSGVKVGEEWWPLVTAKHFDADSLRARVDSLWPKP